MVGNRYTTLLLYYSVLLLSGCCYQKSELTQEYGSELQAAYEEFTEAVAVAYETGDTSRLEDTATGHELEYRRETTGYADAKATAGQWRVAVIRVIVREYSTDTAVIYVEERVPATAGRPGFETVMIVRFEMVDGKWKVSEVEPYPFQS